MSKRYVYSVRRAKHNLTIAIRNEVDRAVDNAKRVQAWMDPVSPSLEIYAREQAVRDLVASVRKECGK